jgi:hypothetical protein
VGDVTCVLLGAEANGRIATTTNTADETRQLICAAIDTSFGFLSRAAKRLGAKRGASGWNPPNGTLQPAAVYFRPMQSWMRETCLLDKIGEEQGRKQTKEFDSERNFEHMKKNDTWP